MASLSWDNFTCDFWLLLYGVKDAPGYWRAYTAHLFAGKKRYENVGFIGWRGMVGSVLVCNTW